jgi:membrane protein
MRSILQFEWRRFLELLNNRIFDADVFSRAAQIAFYFSFALFPLLYFLVSLFGILLDSSDGLRHELYGYLSQIMPASVFDLVRKTVDETVVNSSGGKLTIGLLAALWSASAGVDAMRTALNEINGLIETRAWLRTKLQSLVFTLIISFLVTVVLAAVFYGWQLAQYGLLSIGLEITSPLWLAGTQWLTILLVLLFACEVIYNLLPDLKRFRWIWITPGSIVAIIVWVLLTTGFRLYLGFFNSYNKTYGSLGAVIIMMLWLYLTAFALMAGGAINAVLSEMSDDESS